MLTQKKSRNKTKIIIIAVAIATIALGGLAYLYWKSNNQSPQNQNIDYSPPTTNQKDAGSRAANKEDALKEDQPSPQPNTPAGQKKQASMTIVDASQYDQTVEARAFVDNIVESEGTCTFTFTKGTASISKTSKASPSASTTQCAMIKVTASEFTSKGDWILTVSYDSITSSGKSPERTVKIQ